MSKIKAGSKKSLPGTTSKTKQEESTPKKPKKTIDFQLPPFSILPKKPKEAINWDLIKRNTSRRQSPEGEDLPTLKKILLEIKDKIIPVHDFINTVSPYTADNGALLRTVLEEDTLAFRNLARKVYENMTQDVSDVLVNEQLQLTHFYQERHDLMIEKMMRAVNEIYAMIPEFDFDKFIQQQQEYLNHVLPIPELLHKSDEDRDIQRRQEAYHRLQWLKSEGERMFEENKRLQARLQELKLEQKLEQQRIADIAAEAEAKQYDLIEQEKSMKEKLEELNSSMEKSIVQNEANLRKIHDQTVGRPVKKEEKKTKNIKKKKDRPEWISEIATNIEDQQIHDTLNAEAIYLPPESPVKKQPSPCPCPSSQQRETSLPRHGQKPVEQKTQIESATEKVHEKRPVYCGRRNLAPKDSWRGFH